LAREVARQTRSLLASMVARGNRAAPPEHLTSIHVPMRPTSRQRGTLSPKKRLTSRAAAARALSRGGRYMSPQGARSKTLTSAPVQNRSTPARIRESRESLREFRDPEPSPMGVSQLSEAYGEETCDYDTGATTLYELLESSNWEKARSRCRSHPEEVRTWIVRKDRSLEVRWKLLPLHAAIIFQSPNFVVSTLLEKYPAAASRQDDQGMLPLHLAFRHKQEDEDLLELLLVQCPKAVMTKDRRDRVPLEHGRDCKFSAKLMRLFADATVAASRAMTKYDQSSLQTTKTDPFSGGHDRQMAQLEADHEEAMAQTRAELIAENDRRLSLTRREYEKEIKQLKKKSSEAAAQLDELTKQARLNASQERQHLVEEHKEEMNELRDLLTNQVRKDRMMRDALENEVTGLHSDLNDARDVAEREHRKFSRMKTHVREIHDLLATLCEDHIKLQDLVEQQYDEAENARVTRRGFLQSLIDCDQEGVGSSRDKIARINEINIKLQQTLEQAMEHTDEFSQHQARLSDNVEPITRNRSEEGVQHDFVAKHKSRTQPMYLVEEERDHETNDERYDDAVRETLMHEEYHHVEKRDVHEQYRVEIGDEVPSQEEKRISERDKRAGRILADDISAITDNTEF